jgi:tRNA pseudouridine38-40 synthase
MEPAAPPGDGGLRRVRLDISYDGGGFSGWARQPGLRTVQGEIEDALTLLARAPMRLTVAGRTDAGVHATGQVAHLDVDDGLPDLRRLNGILGADVVVRSLGWAATGFDARFSALSRSYRYRVTDGAPEPLRRHDTVTLRRALDVTLMSEAAGGLLGLRDFAAYCRRREGATTIRTLQRLDVTREEGVVTFSVQADAFCHSMVRSLVGALLEVGTGARAVDWPAGLLQREGRAGEVPVARAHGLTLVRVDYPPEGELAARARATRPARSLDDC